ncbi:MAG TPA: tetratricopeptide repeat protein [Chthoniobacterales bacterium]
MKEAIEIRDDASARVRLARLYATAPVGSLRDVTRAREHADRALKLGSDDIDVMNELANVYIAIGDNQQAIAAINAVIRLEGDPEQDDEKKKRIKSLQDKLAVLQGPKQKPAAPTGGSV